MTFNKKTSNAVNDNEQKKFRKDFSGNTIVNATEMPSTIRWDESGGFFYVGFSEPGAATSSAVWSVARIDSSSGTLLWADGDIEPDNIWDNRASLSYS